MKKIPYLACILLIIALQFSCKKYEQLPLENYDEDTFFDPTDQNGVLALGFLNNIFIELPQPGALRISNAGLDAATDDATSSTINTAIENMANGRWTANNNPDDAWGANYRGIRKANIFLTKIDAVPVTPDTKILWKAQARFLRAMFYFELVKRYGGVPLLGDKVLTLNDNEALYPARNTYAECVNYILAECDVIKDLLPVDPISGADLGRPTQGAVLALKSRLLLYMASPLNNPTGEITKWQAAADAAKDVMNLNKFSLRTTGKVGLGFSEVFTVRQNNEVIFAFQRANTDDLERALAPIGYLSPVASDGHVSPSQNLVDAFPSANGLAITNPINTTYNSANPYANRDPRLAFTVFTNGAMWLNRAIQTYEGGLDKPGGSIRQTRTGYYQRKFLANLPTATAYSTQTHNYTIFRYAEILLNYAEAINETGVGIQQTEALNQLKALRLRAGIPPGDIAGYQHGLRTDMTQVEMRDAIRLERRIEMAFEEQRFWDLRRWKIAEEVLNNKPLMGVTIVRNATTNELTYTPSSVLKMVFTPKMYWEPIPYNEIVKNPNLIQNPNW